MLNFFKKAPALEEDSVQWLFNAYAWALQNYGTDVFSNETRLIEPSKEFFPGGGDTPEEVATVIFEKVQEYSGLSYWPCLAISHYDYDDSLPKPSIASVIQGQSDQPLPFFFEPQQVTNPDAMIANYAHAFGHHLGALAQQRPPCDEEQWPHMAELLAIYMGFGIMMVNSARPQKSGGCGSCRNPAMDRQGFLTEAEAAYALAIFCVLKNIPAKHVTPRLKDYMRGYFKKALKDAKDHEMDLSRLRAIDAPSKIRGKRICENWKEKRATSDQSNIQVSVSFQTPDA